MKKTLFLIVCLMAMSPFANAQTAIAKIRKHYNDVKQLTTTMADPYKFPAEMDENHSTVPSYYHLNIEENYPGTGMHHENVFIYHDEVEGRAEEVFPPKRISFVTVKYNFAASNFYEEYLYDKSGRPEFIYVTMPEDADFQDTEYRFYFSSGKLIKAIVKTRSSENADFKEVHNAASVPAKYNSNYQLFLKKADQYKKLFQAVYAAQRF